MRTRQASRRHFHPGRWGSARFRAPTDLRVVYSPGGPGVAPRLALLLLAILRLELREAGLRIHIDRAIRRLRALDETLVVYADGSADRVLTEMDPTQHELADALGLAELARELGTTVLADA